MDLSLFFAGTGGSVPAARRGLPAVLVRRGGDRLLFDCGEGTQRQLLRSVGLVDMDSVFVTHFHADHWLGLPGMLKSLALRERDLPLAVYGPRGIAELMGVMRIIYGRLPFELSVVELDPAQAVQRDGYRVAAVTVQHGAREAYGYALVEDERAGEFDPGAAERLATSWEPTPTASHCPSTAGREPGTRFRPPAARTPGRRRESRAGHGTAKARPQDRPLGRHRAV